MKLGFSDIVAGSALLVAIPYAAGFAMYQAYFSTLGVNMSEFDLAQAEHFQAAMRVAKAEVAPHLGGDGVATAALALCIAGIVAVALAPVGTLRLAGRMRRGLIDRAGLVWIVLFLAAILSALWLGGRHGREQARLTVTKSIDLPDGGIFATGADFFATMPPIDAPGWAEDGRLLSEKHRTTFLFSDGRTALFLSRANATAAPALLRVPLGDDRALFTIWTEQDDADP